MLTKITIGNLTGEPPAHIKIDLKCKTCSSVEHGAPSCESMGKRFNISISHSQECVVVAVGSGVPVGVDVELINETFDWEQIFSQIGTARERLECKASPTSVLDLWCKKEAILKSFGYGFMLDPKTISLQPGVARQSYTHDCEPMHATVDVRSLTLPTGYCGALAVIADTPYELVISQAKWKHNLIANTDD